MNLSELSPSGLMQCSSSDDCERPLKSDELVWVERDVDGRLDVPSGSGLDSAELQKAESMFQLGVARRRQRRDGVGDGAGRGRLWRREGAAADAQQVHVLVLKAVHSEEAIGHVCVGAGDLGLLNARYWDVGGSDGGEEVLGRGRQTRYIAPFQPEAGARRRRQLDVVHVGEMLGCPRAVVGGLAAAPLSWSARRAGM